MCAQTVKCGKELLMALWLSQQCSVDERDNEEQSEGKKQKNKKKISVHRQFVNLLCIVVTACPVGTTGLLGGPVTSAMLSHPSHHTKPLVCRFSIFI